MPRDYLKTFPQYLMPKKALTRLAGLLARVTEPRIKDVLIQGFIEKFQVNMTEALEENPQNYACFNDFFIRHLKPNIRPLADARVVSPVDGVISELGTVKEGQILQAKGRYYTVDELLVCDSEQSQPFINGYFATLYLAPKDYHRIHMPIDARLRNMIYVPGRLFSVQPTTARVIPQLFARNERLVVFFDTALGLMAMVLVGATIVGAIGTSWEGDIKRSKGKQYFDYQQQNIQLRQGDEMGYFKLGSTVILMLADQQPWQWLENLCPGSSIKFGEALGNDRPTL